MKNIAQVWGRQARRQNEDVNIPWVDPKQLIGIEIEAEHAGARLPDPSNVSNFWETTSDGSLQSGNEYRLNRPMAGNDLSNAIRLFFQAGEYRRALTSGTHIHMDMMEENTSLGIMQTLYLLVYILEPAIYQVVDPGREWCGYTNSLESGPADMHSVILASDLEDAPQKLIGFTNEGRRFKYYGLNLVPLSRFGSVEFRYFPTATSEAEMVDWVQFVMSFKAAAGKLRNVPAVGEVLANVSSYEEFIHTNFETWATRILSAMPYGEAVRRYKQATLKHAVSATNKRHTFDNSVAEIPRFKKFFNKAFAKLTEMRERLGASSNYYRIFDCTQYTQTAMLDRLRQMSAYLVGSHNGAFMTGDLLISKEGVLLYAGGAWIPLESIENDWSYFGRALRGDPVFYKFVQLHEEVVAKLNAIVENSLFIAGSRKSTILAQIDRYNRRAGQLVRDQVHYTNTLPSDWEVEAASARDRHNTACIEIATNREALSDAVLAAINLYRNELGLLPFEPSMAGNWPQFLDATTVVADVVEQNSRPSTSPPVLARGFQVQPRANNPEAVQ